LDEYWPEFDQYITDRKREVDFLCVPLDGKKYGKPNYAWTTNGFGLVKQSRFVTLQRSYASRKVRVHGAARQAEALAANEKLAARYASLLPFEVTHVTVMQHLLPYLWSRGALAGRTFDVLMTRLPLGNLQDRLDAAFRLHPESPTLSDFRASAQFVKLEAAALRQARKIVTPHTEIAALFPGKSELLPWALKQVESAAKATKDEPVRIAFPAATVGRKGVYELREALTGLDIELRVTGPILENKNFWDGVRVIQLRPGADWLENVALVVLPSFVEHNPRKLLEALAHGVPVIASAACGLENVSGVITVPVNSGALRAEIQSVLKRRTDAVG
jgi:hypothetical protein